MPKIDASKLDRVIAERDRRRDLANGLAAARTHVAELERREWKIIYELNRSINDLTGTGPGPDSVEDEPGEYSRFH